METGTAAAAWREHDAVLGDGRVLGLGEFGPSDGFPLLWFPGTPGARRQVPPAAVEAAYRVGARIVCVERPGMGRSTSHRYARVLDWAADVEQVVDGLGIGRFGLVGLSGGGPYVLACAYAMPDRVVAAAVLAGVAPSVGPDAQGSHRGVVHLLGRLAWALPPLREPVGRTMSLLVRWLHPLADAVFDVYGRVGPRSDRAFLARPEMRAMFLDDLVTSGRRGFAAVAHDAVLFSRPWGFDLADVDVPVFFFHGDDDMVVPVDQGERMAALVPRATWRAQPGVGHLAVLDHAVEAIALVLARAPRDAGSPPAQGPGAQGPGAETAAEGAGGR